MNILIVYGTNSSGTREAAELVASVFAYHNHHVTLKSAQDAMPDDILNHDLVVLGSCTWERITPTRRFEGQLQEHFIEFRERLRGKEFNGKRFAVFALGDSTYTNFCIAANHLVALAKTLRGEQIGDTLRIDGFFFHPEENQKKIISWVSGVLKALTKAPMTA